MGIADMMIDDQQRNMQGAHGNPGVTHPAFVAAIDGNRQIRLYVFQHGANIRRTGHKLQTGRNAVVNDHRHGFPQLAQGQAKP